MFVHQNKCTVLQSSLWNRMVSVAVLAVHVSKKHGIREGVWGPGGHISKLPQSLSLLLLVTRQGNTVGQPCPA